MPRNTNNPLQALNVAITNLDGCGPALDSLSLQPRLWNGTYEGLTQRNNAIAAVKASLVHVSESLEHVTAEFTAQQRDTEQRYDSLRAQLRQTQEGFDLRNESLSTATRLNSEYRARIEKLEQTLVQRTNAYNQATRQRDDALRQVDVVRDDLRRASPLAEQQAAKILNLEGHLDTAKDDARYYRIKNTEQLQTIDNLTHQLNATNRELERITAARAPPTPTSPTNLHPSSAGGPGRASSDSGFSDGSNNTDAGDKARQDFARTLYQGAVDDFDSGDYSKARDSFAGLQDFIRRHHLRQAVSSATLSYYRAICAAEIGTENAAAETKLNEYLQYERVERSQKAYATHILARTLVKLGRLDEAETCAWEAVGLWKDIDATGERYADATALLTRVFHLQKKSQKAIAAFDMCPEARKQDVRNKYLGLQVPASTTSSRSSSATARPADAQPPVVNVPKSARKTGSAVSSSTTSSRRSGRRDGLAAWMRT